MTTVTQYDNGTLALERITEKVLRCVFTRQRVIFPPSDWITLGTPVGGKPDAELVGETLRWRSVPPLTLRLTEKTLTAYDTGGAPPQVERVRTVDGERNFIHNLAPHPVGVTYEAQVAMGLRQGETLHGLGQGEDGAYNRGAGIFYMYQHNMRIPIPVLFASRDWAILFDCGCLMTLEGGVMTLAAVPQLDFYLITGTADERIAAIQRLTGSVAMLPRWAFGYLQSKEAYRTQEELVAVAREYRRREIPLDCVIQDWNTWEPGRWGEKRLDPTRYPSMEEASRALRALHVHTLVSVWPNMNTGTADHTQMQEAGKLLFDLSTYNAFDRDARRMYWEQLERGLFSKGFDGWWCDSTEPFSGPDWGGAVRRAEEERFRLVGGEHEKYLGPERANTYALAHAKGIWENQRRSAPDRRVVNLTRSGWIGSQALGTILWSGDVSARWDVMRAQIAEGLNMAMSGQPYWTFDIGGFFVVNTAWQKRGCGCNTDPEAKWFWQGGYNDGVDDPAYRELYTRWLQLGCFMPVFRSHGTDTPREIWAFGEPGTEFYDAIAAGIRLRYRLLPYLYSLAGAAFLTGGTILRPLLFDFPEDPTAERDDEYLFGPSLLVCPVLEPQYYSVGGQAIHGKAQRCCALPDGSDWYDWYTGERLRGGRSVTVETPLDRIPLFVRAGAILPLAESAQYAQTLQDESVLVRVYPGADGSFCYYDDAGDGYDCEQGGYLRIPMVWTDETRTLTLGDRQGTYPVSGRSFRITAGGVERQITYTGAAISVTL